MASSVANDKLLSVAVIGSSGGGTATLGHTDDVESQFRLLNQHLQVAGAQVAKGLWITCHKPMDAALPSDQATLYQIENGKSKLLRSATLQEVNAQAKKLQQSYLAEAINQNQIDALICVSCSVELFKETLQSAGAKQIPVTGSGGTSLSQAVALCKIHLVGNAGGSVATDRTTRVISYVYALASYWKRPYEPWKVNDTTKPAVAASFVSVWNACLPVFWGACLTKACINHGLIWLIPADNYYHEHLQATRLALETWVLPATCAAAMALQQHGQTGLSSSQTGLVMAAVISGASTQSALQGLFAGWLVAQLSSRVQFGCIRLNVPATMTNLITAGGVGGLVALFMAAIDLSIVTRAIRECILWTVTQPHVHARMATGFVWGCASCYASKVGGYHAVMLPTILIEMEAADASFLGAVDELTLVVVCAGICAGQLVLQGLGRVSQADAALCRRAVSINLGCGDFVEACYPFTDRHVLVNLGGYLASGAAVARLVASAESAEQVPKSLAYLPFPVAVALAGSQWLTMVWASLWAFGISFLATVMNGLLFGKRIPAKME